MSWIITIIIGGLVGWIAGLIMRTRLSVLADIIIGIVGSFLGVWLFSMILGLGPVISLGAISLLGIIWSIIGAMILIAIIEAVVPGTRMGMHEDEIDRERERRHERGVAHEYEDIEIKKKRRKRNDEDEY